MVEQRTDGLNDIDAMTDEQRAAVEAEEIARRARGGTGVVDKGLGEMGGAGAQGGIEPDVSKITPSVVKP
jgi:hypothetical protein